MNIPLDEVIYFDAITTHPTTGAATDADSTPTFAVYEESTDSDIGVGGNLTKRTSLTGNYRGTFTLSAANGFEVGKWYSIIGSATVNSIAGKAVLKNFRCVAAEAIAGKPKADLDAWLGVAPLALSSQQVQAVVPSTQKVDVDTIKTQAITCSAGVTVGVYVGGTAAAAIQSDMALVKTATNTGVAPGAAGGLFIAGSNAATTTATWTVTGACTNGSTILGATTMVNASGVGLTINGSTHGVESTGVQAGAKFISTATSGASTCGVMITGAHHGLKIEATSTTSPHNAVQITNASTSTGAYGIVVSTSGGPAVTISSPVDTNACQLTTSGTGKALALTGGYATDTITVSGATTFTGSVTATNASNNIVGVTLAAAGLDGISTTAPAGVASNFREMVIQTWRRFFRKADKTSTQIKTYADNGTSVLTTQTVSDSGGTETQGTAT